MKQFIIIILLALAACNNQNPSVYGEKAGKVYCINPGTYRVSIANKQTPLICSQYWKADSVWVCEAFMTAFKGGKPKVTIFYTGEVMTGPLNTKQIQKHIQHDN